MKRVKEGRKKGRDGEWFYAGVECGLKVIRYYSG